MLEQYVKLLQTHYFVKKQLHYLCTNIILSYLKQKSGFNIDAAELLIEKGMHAPSVHCSYYGCLQFMKHTLKNFLKTSYEEIDEISANTSGSHVYIINNVLSNYRKKCGDREFRTTKRSIADLKEFRLISDYKNTEIIIDQSEKALSLSKSIIEEVKNKLK